jgi:hypothetical protein
MTTHTPSDLRRFEPVSDALLLAAIDRAQRHSSHGSDAGVHWGAVLNHLGFAHTGATTRKLRPQADALIARGLIETLKRHSRPVIKLTSSGRRRLAKARRAERESLELPEAPQHRLWRERRATSAAQIDSAREQLGKTLDEARRLFEEGGASDSWFALSAQLSAHAVRFASATYQVSEWPEPDDARADLDEPITLDDPRLPRRSRLSVREVAK